MKQNLCILLVSVRVGVAQIYNLYIYIHNENHSQETIRNLSKQLLRQLVCSMLQRCDHSLILAVHSGNVLVLHFLPLATADGGLSIEFLAHLVSLVWWEMFGRHARGALR